jgi:hypothetical protein
MIFKHLRAPRMTIRDRKGDLVEVHEDASGVTIAYTSSRLQGTNEHWIRLGMAFSSPKAKCWPRKKMNRIAAARAKDNPLLLQLESFDSDVTEDVLTSLLRTFVIELPHTWEPVPNVLRPSRFNRRAGVGLVGPAGSLLSAYVDFKDPEAPKPTKRGDCVVPLLMRDEETPFHRRVRHWSCRVPSWAKQLIVEA